MSIQQLMQWLEDNERLPKIDNLVIVDSLSTEELTSRKDNSFWLYKPFRVKKEYQKQLIKDCVKNEIEKYFLNTLVYDEQKIKLENWVLSNMNLTFDSLSKELKKRIKIYKEIKNV